MNSTSIKEIWVDIEGYDGRYQVSQLGRVRTVQHLFRVPNQFGIWDKETKPNIHTLKLVKNGYLQVGLRHPVTGKRKWHLVHRLVLMHFNPHVDQKKLIVHHKDHVKTNNQLWNLMWSTNRDNSLYAIAAGRMNYQRGSKHYATARTGINEEKVLEIRELWSTGNYTQPEIAKMYGIRRENVKDIVNRYSWTHV